VRACDLLDSGMRIRGERELSSPRPNAPQSLPRARLVTSFNRALSHRKPHREPRRDLGGARLGPEARKVSRRRTSREGRHVGTRGALLLGRVRRERAGGGGRAAAAAARADAVVVADTTEALCRGERGRVRELGRSAFARVDVDVAVGLWAALARRVWLEVARVGWAASNRAWARVVELLSIKSVSMQRNAQVGN
jgi:hypothetical protein